MIEILVVIAILLALTTIVVMGFNANAAGDRLRSAGRIAQSAFLGARDRALHAGAANPTALSKARRGIRLLRDSGDASLANGFVFVQPIDSLQYGSQPPVNGLPIEILNIDITGDFVPDVPRQVKGYGVDWDILFQNGQLPFPPRIRINLAGNSQWYTFTNVQLIPATNPREVTLDLTTDYLDPDNPPPAPIAVPQTSSKATCEIDVGFEMLPNHAPMPLPSGVVIDLFFSQIPTSWYVQQSIASTAPIPPGWVSEGSDPFTAGNILIRFYQPALDVMFSPRGMVTGPIAGLGPLHFLLNDIQDASQNLNPIDPANRGEKLVLTVFPQTGHVQAYPIDPTDAFNNITGIAGADGFADDLFRYAKIGSRPGQ